MVRRCGALICLGLLLVCTQFSAVRGECKCEDKAPSDEFTCKQQKDNGKCEASWMKEGKFCQKTCGHCSCEGDSKEGSSGEGQSSPKPKSSPKPRASEPSPRPKSSPKPAVPKSAPKPAADVESVVVPVPGATTPKETTAAPKQPRAAAPKAAPVGPIPEGCTCTDLPPPDTTYTCQEQRNFGQCVEDWMQTGGFCQWTCGYCTLPNCPGAPKLEDIPVDPTGAANWVDPPKADTDSIAAVPPKATTPKPTAIPEGTPPEALPGVPKTTTPAAKVTGNPPAKPAAVPDGAPDALAPKVPFDMPNGAPTDPVEEDVMTVPGAAAPKAPTNIPDGAPVADSAPGLNGTVPSSPKPPGAISGFVMGAQPGKNASAVPSKPAAGNTTVRAVPAGAAALSPKPSTPGKPAATTTTGAITSTTVNPATPPAKVPAKVPAAGAVSPTAAVTSTTLAAAPAAKPAAPAGATGSATGNATAPGGATGSVGGAGNATAPNAAGPATTGAVAPKVVATGERAPGGPADSSILTPSDLGANDAVKRTLKPAVTASSPGSAAGAATLPATKPVTEVPRGLTASASASVPPNTPGAFPGRSMAEPKPTTPTAKASAVSPKPATTAVTAPKPAGRRLLELSPIAAAIQRLLGNGTTTPGGPSGAVSSIGPSTTPPLTTTMPVTPPTTTTPLPKPADPVATPTGGAPSSPIPTAPVGLTDAPPANATLNATSPDGALDPVSPVEGPLGGPLGTGTPPEGPLNGTILSGGNATQEECIEEVVGLDGVNVTRRCPPGVDVNTANSTTNATANTTGPLAPLGGAPVVELPAAPAKDATPPKDAVADPVTTANPVVGRRRLFL